MAKRFPDCGHDTCSMEEALHERGACTEYDQIVAGVYCPIVVCQTEGVGSMLPTWPYSSETAS